MGVNEGVLERFKSAIESNDMQALSRFMMEVAADDFVQEWPQSGERIVGREKAMKLFESYGQATGTMPAMTFRRMLGSGDTYVVEGNIDYGDGTPVSYIGIAEFRDGKITKMTEYFANPFEAPAWRAEFVERMEPVGA